MSGVSISDHPVSFGGKEFVLRFDIAALVLVERYAGMPYATALANAQMLTNTTALFAGGAGIKPAEALGLISNIVEHGRMVDEIAKAFRKSQPEYFAKEGEPSGDNPSPLK